VLFFLPKVIELICLAAGLTGAFGEYCKARGQRLANDCIPDPDCLPPSRRRYRDHTENSPATAGELCLPHQPMLRLLRDKIAYAQV